MPVGVGEVGCREGWSVTEPLRRVTAPYDFAIAPIGPRERNDLLELLDERVGTRACIVTSQLPVNAQTRRKSPVTFRRNSRSTSPD
jgi:hypothetical protein